MSQDTRRIVSPKKQTHAATITRDKFLNPVRFGVTIFCATLVSPRTFTDEHAQVYSFATHVRTLVVADVFA
jgi:hypothetical protein